MKKSLKIARYSSHLPILKLMFDNIKISKAVEFGMGDFSTSFFREMDLDKLISIETNKKWAEKFTDKKPCNHTIIVYEKKDLYRVDLLEDFDLCFVDSNPADTRIDCINKNINKSKIMIFHDSQHPKLNNREIIEPSGYSRFDYHVREGIPDTSVIMKNEFINRNILNFFSKG